MPSRAPVTSSELPMLFRVAQVGERDLGERLGRVLADGEHVGQHLGGVPLVGQTVPDRDARVRGQLLDQLLAVPPVLDPVEHPARAPGRSP